MTVTESRFVAVEVEDVDVAQADRYERAIETLIRSMREANLGSEFQWNASQHDFSYYYSFPLTSLQDLDPDTGVIQQRFRRLSASIDPDAADAFSMVTARAVQATRLFILERVAEFTHEAPNSVVEAAKHAFLDIHYVRTGQAEPYKKATRRLMAAARKSDYPLGWSAYRMVIGEGTTFYGEGKVYCYVVPFDSPSQFYEQHSFQGAMVQELGEESARELLMDERRCLVKLETSEHRLRPELSYTPEPAQSEIGVKRS